MIVDSKICCGNFEKMFAEYDWVSFEGGGSKLIVMPTSKISGLRINNCPSCGYTVRSTIVSEEYFNKFI